MLLLPVAVGAGWLLCRLVDVAVLAGVLLGVLSFRNTKTPATATITTTAPMPIASSHGRRGLCVAAGVIMGCLSTGNGSRGRVIYLPVYARQPRCHLLHG